TAPEVELRLRFVLQRFYDVGYELYGVRLNAENFRIVRSMIVNAFATGSWIGLNQGALQYFLNPVQYMIDIGAFPRTGYTVGQYNSLIRQFGWRDDWNSIYFILAHEAGHNLMRHRDETVWNVVLENYGEYSEAVVNYRKDVARGRGGGVKRYLGKSLTNILEGFAAGDKSRGRESEADAVATLLLKRAGFDPAIAVIASQRMARLVAPAPAGGWQNVMTKALCSTHPDWMQRIAGTQQTLNCVQWSDNLCENHIAYPVEQMLEELSNGMDELDVYHKQTVEISSRDSRASDGRFEVTIGVKPKDADLFVDGNKVRPGKLDLAVGRHDLLASKEGFKPFEGVIVVFPDIHPKIKIKLKRKKK
ncbi:MAG: M48 family metalloprotease, partial [Acidobacteriota bacterium]